MVQLLDSCPPELLAKFSKLSRKEAIDELEKALEWKRENSKFEFFEPTGKQEEFIKLVGSGSDMVYVFSAANRIGKTTLLVNALASVIWGSPSPWFEYPIFKSWPYPKRARIVTDPELAKEAGPIHTEILKWWPKGRYAYGKGGKQHFSEYKANGWHIDVMTYDQDIRQFEGTALGLVIFDEPPKESIWHACMARLMTGGIAMIFMTPLVEAAWVFDKLVPEHQNSIVYGALEDACKEHGVRGYLEHEHIQKVLNEMNPDEREARAFGKAMYLKGLIFKSFNYDVHVAKEPISVPEDAQMYHIVDPHTDKPFAMVWGFPDDAGVWNQVAEWPNEPFEKMHACQFGIDDYRKIIKAKELGWNIKKRIIDHHFADVRSLQTKRTLREDFQHIGINFEPSYTASEEVDTGILKVRSYLKYNPAKPIDSVNHPRYLVSPTCKNTIKAFQRWSFDMKTGEPKEDYKDFMDCVRYALMADPKKSYSPPDQQIKRLYG